MGRKIIPLSLRLNKKKNWQSQWFTNKEEYSNLLFIDLEIKKYLETMLNINLYSYKLKKINNDLILQIVVPYLYQNKEFLTVAQSNIQKFVGSKYNVKVFYIQFNTRLLNTNNITKEILRAFEKKHRINFKFKKSFYPAINSVLTQNPDNFATFLKYSLEKKRIQKKQISYIVGLLSYLFHVLKPFKGYKIQFKGRIDGRKRSQKLTFQKGSVPLSTISNNVKYAFNEYVSPSGVCSIKVWFYLK